MTELRGARARWGAAALVAPAGAALIAVTTNWALHHDPTAAAKAAAKPVVSTPPPVPAVDPQVASLREQLAAQQQRIASMEQLIAQVRGQTTALQALPVEVASPPPPSTGYVAAGPSTPLPAPVRVVPQPVAAPAPRAQAVTGASGARP